MMNEKIYGEKSMRPSSPRYEQPPRTWEGKRITSAVSNQRIEFINETDDDDNPAGGRVEGCGFHIYWQDGPVDREAGEEAHGAFVEDVLLGVINRMEFYQGSKFACEENDSALSHLRAAHTSMMERRWDREKRGVQGKHEV